MEHFLGFIEFLRDRLEIAGLTVPTGESWLVGLGLTGIYALVALAIGFPTGFLQVTPAGLPWGQKVALAGRALITPAILEELFFRGLLLPHPGEQATLTTQLTWSIISLLLFVIYHPLNGFSFFPPGRNTFVQPTFLVLAALLGAVCTIVYLYSGSLWLPVILHWVVVAVWLLELGGYHRLQETSLAQPPGAINKN